MATTPYIKGKRRNNMMGMNELVELVRQMRYHQKAFFKKTGDHDYHLTMSKKLEHEVDKAVEEFGNGQQDLFCEQGDNTGRDANV